MPDITITLSDGTPHTAALDSDGWLPLPRGKKPAEPWYGKCDANFQGVGCTPDDEPPDADDTNRACQYWAWLGNGWYRIRPLPGHTWESIAAEASGTPNVGDEIIRGLRGFRDSLQAKVEAARDYSKWQEGLGDSAKPEDYDKNPERYEVEWFSPALNEWVKDARPFSPSLMHRFRLRPLQTAVCHRSPPPESDEAFLRRVLLAKVEFVVVDRERSTFEIADSRIIVPHADALRLATLIGGAS